MKAIDAFLVDWFGDMRILMTDRVQAANIRARVAESIQDCVDAGCGTIVVVGHSGGTIVGYMTLADEAYASLPVSTFVTHGQALTPRVAPRPLRRARGHGPSPRPAVRRRPAVDGPHPAAVPERTPLVRLLGDPRPGAGRRVRDRSPPDPARGHRRPVHPGVQPDERPQRPRRLLGERRGVHPPGRAAHRPVAGGRPGGLALLPGVLGDPPARAPRASGQAAPVRVGRGHGVGRGRRPARRSSIPCSPAIGAASRPPGAAAWAAIGTFVTTFGPVLHFFEIDLTVEPISGSLAILVGVIAMLAVYVRGGTGDVGPLEPVGRARAPDRAAARARRGERRRRSRSSSGCAAGPRCGCSRSP